MAERMAGQFLEVSLNLILTLLTHVISKKNLSYSHIHLPTYSGILHPTLVFRSACFGTHDLNVR